MFGLASMKFFEQNGTTFNTLQVASIKIESLGLASKVSALLGQLTVRSTKHFKEFMTISKWHTLMLMKLLGILVYQSTKTSNVTVVS